jgi:hypothetical protein
MTHDRRIWALRAVIGALGLVIVAALLQIARDARSLSAARAVQSLQEEFPGSIWSEATHSTIPVMVYGNIEIIGAIPEPIEIVGPIRRQWEALEQCFGVERDPSEVRLYVAVSLIAQHARRALDPRPILTGLYGVYFTDPAEVFFSPVGLSVPETLLVLRHEFAHHFAGVTGDGAADHADPDFVRCSGGREWEELHQ